MRCIVLSDLHANAAALEAVMTDAAGAYDAALVLGDLVGYGGSPNEVLDVVRGLPLRGIVRGNHDRVGAGLEDGRNFNAGARAAALWARDTLTVENLAWLKALPMGPLPLDEGVLLCHGSPLDEDAYVFGPADVIAALRSSAHSVVLFGHTHLPMALRLDAAGQLADGGTLPGRSLWLQSSPAQWMINPGSVGQPRDGDCRAAYGVLDTELWTYTPRRVAYDIAASQQVILAAGLPAFLAERLSFGA